MFCKVPSASAVWLFYMVIKAVVEVGAGMRYRVVWGRQQYRMLAACSAEFSDQRGHECEDLDGLQSTHSHSKGYISFPYFWRTQRHQGHLES